MTPDAALLQAALDAFPLPCTLIDEAMNIVAVNDALREFLNEPDLQPQSYEELARRYLTPDNAKRVADAVRQAAAEANPKNTVEVAFSVRRDFVFRIEVRRLRLPDTGLYIVSHLDLTRERQRVEELERIRTERERTERVARLGSWRLDLRTGENTWSPETYVVMGQDPATFVPSLENRRRIQAPSAAPTMEAIERAISNGHPFRARYEIIRPGGAARLIENVGEPQRDASGSLIAYFGTVRDVTEEVAHEQELDRDRQRLERAQAISRTGDIEVDLTSSAAVASSEFRRLFDLDDDDVLDMATLQQRVHPDDRARMALFWTDPRAAARAANTDVMYRVVWRTGEIRHLRGRAQLRVSSGGRECISAFAQDVTDQVQAAEDLRLSERRLSQAEAIANLGHWEWFVQTGALTWSRQVFAIAGIDDQPVTYNLFLELIHPDDRQRVTDAVQAALDDDVPYEVVHRMVRPDGSIRTVLERGELSRTPDGAPYRMLGIVQDITESVAASEQVRLSEARLRAAEEIAGIGSWEWDTRTGQVEWSDGMYRIFGRPTEQPIHSDDYLELVHPDDREFVSMEVRALLRGEDIGDRPHRIVRPDGTTRVIRREIRVVERDSEGGAVRLLGTAADITESVAATEQLRLSEARLRAAEEIAGIGSWEWDVRSGRIEWSDEVYRVYGFSPGEYVPHASRFLEIVHPDDRERVVEETEAVLRGEYLFDHRHRIVRPDGGVRIVRRNARVVERDQQGRAVRLVGTTQDITEAVEAEERLRDSESRLRLAVEVARLGHWEWDLRSDGLRWSDENYRVHGLEPGDVVPLGGQFDELIDPAARAEAREAMKATLKGLRDYNVTHKVRCPDGVTRTMRTMARVAERDEQGRAVRLLGTTQDVTEQTNHEAALERLTAVLAQSSAMAGLAPYEWHPRARDWWWSDQLYLVIGYAPQEITPNAESLARLLHPSDRDRVWAAWLEGARTRAGWDVEYQLVRGDGSVRIVRDLSAWIPGDGTVPGFFRGAIQDITHLVELRQQAQDAADEVMSIIDASLLPIIVIDEHGTVQRANGATERVFGWEVEDLVGLDVGVLAADVSMEEHSGYLAHYLATGGASTPEGLVVGRTREVRGRRKDGSEFPAQLTVAEAELGTGRRQFVGIVMDLTEQKTTEEHLRQMQKSEALGTLVAGVAHDFNNLLTAIRGGIDMAQEFPDQPRWLEIATQASDRAAEVVRQLLRFSRRDEPQQVELDPAEMIREVTILSRETLDRRIWFTSHADNDLPPILGDPGQMQQVLLNLIVNARDAVLEKAEHEPGTFEPAIQITARALMLDGHPGVIFEVRDNGTGMTDEVRERALDPFFTTKRADRGTGLGLASVVGIVQRHEGDIRIRTKLGEGTEFGVWLPSRQKNEGPVNSPAEAQSGETDGGGQSPTIFVVDDEEQLGAIAVAYLRSAGFDAIAFTNGRDALAEADRRPASLAILDVNMPSPNGWEVLAALRRRDPDLPVLVCSGFAEEEEARSRGATAVLPKPYGRTQLVEAVRDALRRD